MPSKRTFQLIDLDRTLFNTSLFLEKIYEHAEKIQSGIGEKIAKLVDTAYKQDETFFALEYLRQTLGVERYDAIIKDIINQTTADTWLLPGAKERLLFADQVSKRSLVSVSHKNYGILSYSLYPEDQHLKVTIAGLVHIPLYITDNPNKAMLLRTWQQPAGGFLLPDAFGSDVVDTITLEDDKLRAFRHLPKGVKGIWITAKPDARQQLSMSGIQQVVIARNLTESITYLKHLL